MDKFIDVLSKVITFLLICFLAIGYYSISNRLETYEIILCVVSIYFCFKYFKEWASLVKLLLSIAKYLIWISFLAGGLGKILVALIGSIGGYIALGIAIITVIYLSIEKAKENRASEVEEYED